MSANCQQNPLTPVTDNPCQQSALMTIADLHGVSLRTARRIQKNGTTTPPEGFDTVGGHLPARKLGKDGKAYSTFRNRYHIKNPRPFSSSAIAQAFCMARHGIRKADSVATAHGITASDVEALRRLRDLAEEVFQRWNGVFSEI